MPGALSGLRVLEIKGIGPGPFAAMLLADMGADVIRVDRPDPENDPAGADDPTHAVLARGRRSIVLDLKSPEGADTLLRLVETSDVLIEGFRPGVMERLGVGPQVCLERNPRLVYGRVTGWGQEGPRARSAGHDINYIALSGALHNIARPGQPPTPPLNYVGDYAGGSLFLLFGIFCALHELQRSGRGQVVDAAIVDGAALLTAPFQAMLAKGLWNREAGTNILDGSAPHYDVYCCADGKYISIAPNEAKFYAVLRDKLGLTGADWDEQHDRALWPKRKEQLTALFAERTRDEWTALLEGTDACFAPVLDLVEAPAHPDNIAREVYTQANGLTQPSPAPRLSRTPGTIGARPPAHGEHTQEILDELRTAITAER
ncbi:carnitine dehydratase [Rhodococcus sp. ACS1]|uniref:CaiB/BaiF CoA transferase family protein n=1 Tax=Rhodococcus sp. ACS1 TaxID=2028570 RepID=UPI000BB0D1B8|nr:CaiB/BaiF CoA-transferase family protein [Rhodococcus sp. ACS1]PBC39477.1 carnitine dehydratase [Rhodococcus sp. ACS1]